MKENQLLNGIDAQAFYNEINYAGVRAIRAINEQIAVGNQIDKEWLRKTTNTLLLLSNDAKVPDFMSSEIRNDILRRNTLLNSTAPSPANPVTQNPDQKITLSPEQEQMFQDLQNPAKWSNWSLPGAPTREQVHDAYRRNGGSSEGIGHVLNSLMMDGLDGMGNIPLHRRNQASTAAPSPDDPSGKKAPDSRAANQISLELSKVNPEFRPQSEVGINKYNTNCFECMLQVDKMLGGAGRVAPMRGVVNSPAELQGALEKLPVGTLVQITQGDPKTRPGSRRADVSPRHYFNAVVTSEGVLYLDGQQNLQGKDLNTILRMSNYQGNTFGFGY